MEDKIIQKQLEEQELQYFLRPVVFSNNRDETFERGYLQKNAQDLVKSVLDGETDPIGAYAELRITLEIIERATALIEDATKTELIKFNKGQYPSNTYGFKMEYQEGRKTYDFSNNPSIVALEEKIKELKEIAKRITEPMAMAETGEMLLPAIVKATKDSIKYTINNDK
jgi:hypothetical protein